VAAARGINTKAVKAWLKKFDPASCRDALCSASDSTFPIRVPLQARSGEGDWIGWLLIGPRPDGSLLSKDEQGALVDVAGPITRAVRIVSRREIRERALLDRIEAIEARLAEPSSKRGRQLNPN
jgi:hypothetical protein